MSAAALAAIRADAEALKWEGGISDSPIRRIVFRRAVSILAALARIEADTLPKLVRDGTICGPQGTEIDFRTEDYTIWLTIKADDEEAEAFAAKLERIVGDTGEATAPCPRCGSTAAKPSGQPCPHPYHSQQARPDYDPRIDHPERYRDGPI